MLTTIVAAFALLAFAHAWRFGFTYLDDNDIILTKASFLAHPASACDSFTHRYFLNDTNVYYRPFVNLSFVLDAHLAGAEPWVYHFTNSALHAGACALMFTLLRQLAIGRMWAALSACLFAVHPMQVASVVWVPGRNDLLLGIFSLGALVLLERRAKNRVTIVGHWLCFVSALLCKETAVCLPIVFAVLAFGRHSKFTKAQKFALGAAWGTTLLGYFVLHRQVVTLPRGTMGKAIDAARAHPEALVSELGKVFVPARLQVVATIKDAHIGPGIAAIGAIVVLLVALRRAVRVRVILMAGGLLMLPLLMVLLASDFVMLENRLYLPVAGASVFVAECMRSFGQTQPRFWRLGAVAVAGIVLVFGVTSFRYSAYFRDRYAFSDAAIKAAPSSYLAIWLQAQRSFHGANGPPKASSAH